MRRGSHTRTRRTLALLGQFESRNVTFVDPDGSWPIVWERAEGVHIWDADGERYLDLTAAFGVAAAGHANSRVVRAGQRQMARLLHAMGDVHPHELKARLAERLSELTFERWSLDASAAVGEGPADVRRARKPARRAHRETRAVAKTIFCNSGFEAVEAGLKTAMLATGRPGIIAFTGGYHGLGYGALNATHRPFFRRPFMSQLGRFVEFVEFPRNDPEADPRVARMALNKVVAQVERLAREKRTGAILVEPIQVRGGINIPPPGFLGLLRRICSEHGLLLVLDEIYTGFGRTGKWFACEHEGVIPDLICLGKALTGGFPLSACVGRADLMDAAWPPSTGEAIHTSTFLGHPVGCAMALAQIEEIGRLKLVERSARLGRWLRTALAGLALQVKRGGALARGLGLLAGLELEQSDRSPDSARAIAAVKAMLQRGYILLPEGEHSQVISFTPPLTISEGQLRQTVAVLEQVLA